LYRACICTSFKDPRNRFPVWRAGTTTLFVCTMTLFVVPARQGPYFKRLGSSGIDSEESISPGWESITGILKRCTSTGSGYICWPNRFLGIDSWAPLRLKIRSLPVVPFPTLFCPSIRPSVRGGVSGCGSDRSRRGGNAVVPARPVPYSRPEARAELRVRIDLL
jgi:hypothetical protein